MFELVVEPTGDVVEVEEGQTILDSLLRSGISIPYQCGHGLCSTCKVTVLEGEVDHGEASPFALMDFERDEGVALACCATAQSDLVIEAEIDVDPDARMIPIQDFTATVERMEKLTGDITGIWLKLDKDMDFQAGQYINLHVPGVAQPRAFSIASPETQPDLIELHVRYVPDGKATGYLHNDLKTGDTLKVSGPLGRFYVRKSRTTPTMFIAGGSGLSSPKSMILDLLDSGFDSPVELFHGTRTVADVYDHQLFETLSEKHENFSYTPVPFDVSDDSGAGWLGEHGALQDVIAKKFADGFKGWTAYLCGPPGMIEVCIRTLMQGRLFEKDIFTEGFLTSAEAETASKSKVFKRI
ncbi:MAG: NADH:ubiquinone reductase (Na(+)-transporting) subunit F [Parvibaculales bacterium]